MNPSRTESQFMTEHALAQNVVKSNPDFCPYCAYEHFHQEDYEFGTKNSWVRYRCIQCHCEWSAVYKLQYGDVNDHIDHNQEAWTNYQEKLRFT